MTRKEIGEKAEEALEPELRKLGFERLNQGSEAGNLCEKGTLWCDIVQRGKMRRNVAMRDGGDYYFYIGADGDQVVVEYDAWVRVRKAAGKIDNLRDELIPAAACDVKQARRALERLKNDVLVAKTKLESAERILQCRRMELDALEAGDPGAVPEEPLDHLSDMLDSARAKYAAGEE